MSSPELIKQLHTCIETADDQMLKVVLDLMKYNEKDDWWNELSNDAKDSFQRGIVDLDSGRYRDSSTVLNEMRERYGKE
jgi:hypothetical protein